MDKPTLEKGYKLGDTVDLGATSTIVTLPDGTSVTARSTYRVMHLGKHKVTSFSNTGEQTTQTIEVRK